ncbi:MAG TPA: c-type cytochrome [Bryobacteraceae bacterium]|nr:c-type cytochrome [Bryobacteraceae bacterium]
MIRKQYLFAAFFAGSIISGLAYAQETPTPVPDPVPIAPGKGVRAQGFTQYTRPLASQDVLIRGKALYNSSCASCHASDMRGAPGKGVNLLRSGIVLSDKAGELIAASVAKHTPKINLVEADNTAISEYLHSIEATMGAQGSPPGRNPMGIELNVLVGDAKAGEAYFAKACASCHSVTGDMKGIASKYADAKALQNGWFDGILPRGGRGGGRGGMQATVTMPDGTTFEGRSIRKDDYILILMLADGTRKSIALDVTPAPKVEMKDPQEAHKKVAMAIDDPDNKNLHDITAFLWTLK